MATPAFSFSTRTSSSPSRKVVVMWAERMTSAWRLPDRSWGDVALVAVLLVEDLYGFFLELCAVAAAGKCLRGIRQYW